MANMADNGNHTLWEWLPSGTPLQNYGLNHQWENIHYFEWSMFNGYVSLPEGNRWCFYMVIIWDIWLRWLRMSIISSGNDCDSFPSQNSGCFPIDSMVDLKP